MYARIGNVELHAELRRGKPWVYFERGRHAAAKGGHYRTAIIGLALLHVSVDRYVKLTRS